MNAVAVNPSSTSSCANEPHSNLNKDNQPVRHAEAKIVEDEEQPASWQTSSSVEMEDVANDEGVDTNTTIMCQDSRLVVHDQIRVETTVTEEVRTEERLGLEAWIGHAIDQVTPASIQSDVIKQVATHDETSSVTTADVVDGSFDSRNFVTNTNTGHSLDEGVDRIKDDINGANDDDDGANEKVEDESKDDDDDGGRADNTGPGVKERICTHHTTEQGPRGDDDDGEGEGDGVEVNREHTTEIKIRENGSDNYGDELEAGHKAQGDLGERLEVQADQEGVQMDRDTSMDSYETQLEKRLVIKSIKSF